MMRTTDRIFLNDEHRTIFEATKDIPGWQMPGDSEKLYEMAYTSGNVILEIGTYGGRSAVVELRGAIANPNRTAPPMFFGIDIEASSIWRTYNSLVLAGLDHHALLYHGTLETFLKEFTIQPTMVFVDGDHRYAGAKSDLLLLATFLRPGIPVLCHDYTNPQNDTGEMGVRQAVQEFVAEGYAEMHGTFGCSAFLTTTDKCQGREPIEITPAEFFSRKAKLFSTYAKALYDQLQLCEGDRAARLTVIQQLQAQLQASQFDLQQVQHRIQLYENGASSTDAIQSLQQQLHQKQMELQSLQKQHKEELEKSQQKVQRVRQKLHASQAELSAVQDRVRAMETSKFWKLRAAWFRLRQSLGLSTEP